ncbi:hypothetical protein HYU07_02860 [Candidatus Woesearchaeota archaeon]|nr:hypothetical protein [Candidatus Woesearchaeota archaeon]
MAKQACPKCGSKKIVIAEGFSKLGNPILTQGLVGWKCLDCGYVGKDFFIVSKTKPKK